MRYGTGLFSTAQIGLPYLTVWDTAQVDCFHFETTGCYTLFDMRCGKLEADIANVHLEPKLLTNATRNGALETIMQRRSAYHAGTIGEGRSIIGGGMNTSKELMTSIFSSMKDKHLLQSDAD